MPVAQARVSGEEPWAVWPKTPPSVKRILLEDALEKIAVYPRRFV